MLLADLLVSKKEAILQEFAEYARTHTTAGASMDVEALRDHAAGMLEAMALDLRESQTEAEQERKGKGDASAVPGAPITAAAEHGLGRARSGFSMEETFAEYRALRASVLRHYVAALSHSDASHVQDLIRFNEAVDQALAEAVREYARSVNTYREMFLAVLGHDLRSPLNAIIAASAFLTEKADRSAPDHHLATTIAHSAKTMNSLIDDMLAYTSLQLGQAPALKRVRSDLGEIAASVIEEVRVSHPEQDIQLRLRGAVVGDWDPGRIRQGIANLITNALRHAKAETPITVTVSAADSAGEVAVTVHNFGDPIPEDEWELIFLPFRRGSADARGQAGTGRLGLGLYITRRMAEAHGGTVNVQSSAAAGTTFSLRLPRSAT